MQSQTISYNMDGISRISQAGLLDPYVIIAADPHNDAVGDRDRIRGSFLLYKTSRIEKDGGLYWYFESVKNPQQFVGTGQWELGQEGSLASYWHYRAATNASAAATYHSYMNRGKRSIYLGGEISQRVHLWNIDKANTILPSTYYHCSHGLDTENEWSFKVYPLAPVVVAPQQQKQSMTLPVHVLRCFMDSAIQRGDTCPITLEPLTKESIAYTSCGHLFDHASIMQCARCPTCRASLGPADIRTYT